MSNQTKNQQNETITEGVTCVVNSCHYHTFGDLCRAGQIEIKPKDAESVNETDCGTYKNEDHNMS